MALSRFNQSPKMQLQAVQLVSNKSSAYGRKGESFDGLQASSHTVAKQIAKGPTVIEQQDRDLNPCLPDIKIYILNGPSALD